MIDIAFLFLFSWQYSLYIKTEEESLCHTYYTPQRGKII